MPGPLTPLGALWTLDERKARARILAALRKTRGNAVHAARELGVSHRQLSRYLLDDRIAEALARIRARHAKPAD